MTVENLNLGNAKANKEIREKHIPSTIQADTLFTFTPRLEYLMSMLKNKRISARYCEEDLSYLKIQNLKKIALPMKCFCDINIHRLEVHLGCYGYYGLAFEKEWGMKKGLQSMQYVNPHSNLIRDFAEAFSIAMGLEVQNEDSPQAKMQNFLLHELMYYKPYSGSIKNRVTEKFQEKCFTDECEWRYIPKVSMFGFHQILVDEQIINFGSLDTLNRSLEKIDDVALSFNCEDLKYIIIEKEEDYKELLDVIKEMDITHDEKYLLVSKIIIWEKLRGDL